MAAFWWGEAPHLRQKVSKAIEIIETRARSTKQLPSRAQHLALSIAAAVQRYAIEIGCGTARALG
jgi:hypothetical protein